MLWRSKEFVVVARKEKYQTYYLISLTSDAVTRFEWNAYGYEDDLYTTAHSVEGGRLIERSTVQGPYHPLQEDVKVLATGLEPASDEATQRLAEAGLARALARAELARATYEQTGRSRVQAIVGARDQLRGGPLVDRAQTALVKRIENWHDDRAGRLLRTLIRLTSEEDVGAEVLQAYARGCLSACFEDALPLLPAPAAARTPNAELAEELKKRVKELEDDADGQERVDANANATAYWRAAKAIQWAADQLTG